MEESEHMSMCEETHSIKQNGHPLQIEMDRYFCPIKTLRTGHIIEEISQDDFARITTNWVMYDGLVRLNPGGWFLSSHIPPVIDKIYDFDFKPDDTLVITYPKSGTTWMQEIVWTLQHNCNLDNPMANISSDMRSPQIEIDGILGPKKMPKFSEDSKFTQFMKKNEPDAINDRHKALRYLKYIPSPRVFKSHLAMELFPPSMLNTSKVIYLARDPRDVIVSKYHFFRAAVAHSFKGSLAEFIDYFLNEEQFNHPYWPHVKSALELRDHPNFLFLYYEDLKANPTKNIKKIAQFLGLTRTPEQIENVVKYTDFKNMKQRADDGIVDQPMSDGGTFFNDIKGGDGEGGFFRKGKSGNWKEAFTAEEIAKITVWMDKNMEMFPDDFKYKSSK